MKKRTYRIFVAFAILAVLIAVGVAGYSVYRQHAPQRNMPDMQESGTEVQRQQASEDTETQEATVTEETGSESVQQGLPEDSYFEIDFFDVGEADSTLVRCDGHYMLIDGGNPGSSSFLYAYLQQNGIDYIDYMVCTHAHEDHVGGLAGALNYAKVWTAYAPVTEYDTRAFNSFVKYLGEQGKSITIPAAGDTFMLGNARVQIVGPVDMSLAGDNANNTSIVVHITYGNTAFLVTGDAEEIEEQSIVNAGYDIRSTVLRVGHHGSYTSTSESFLRAVAPEYCVISVGKDNAYDHPHDEVLNRIAGYGAEVYRTDQNGDITCISDGETVRFSTEK